MRLRRLGFALALIALWLPAAAARPPTIDATLTVAAGPGRTPIFGGRSNLPDGMQLNVMIETPSGTVLQQQLATMRGGRFTTAAFAPGGKPLPPGSYVVHVTSLAPVLQPPTVQEAIGALGEYLAGRYVGPGTALPGQGNVLDERFGVSIR